MASIAVNSVAGGDGNVYNDDAGSWATVKGLTSGTAQPTTDPVNIYAAVFTSRSISRGFLPFLTSSIGSGQSVDSATIRINVSALPASAGGTFHIVASTQADPTTLANGDFGNIPGSSSTMTSFGSQAIGATGLYTFTLNAAGLANINMTGYSKFALVEDHDLTNTDPNPTVYRVSVNMTENGTAGNRPLLTVNYSPAPVTTRGDFKFL